MAKFTDIEQRFLEHVTDDRLRSSLAKLREAAEDIWANDAPRIVQDYTDHGIAHSERLASFAAKLLDANDGRPLSGQEMYLLLAGIYLHDVGMQCDVVRFPEIKSRAEKLGAKFDIEIAAQTSSSYSLDEQKAIRKNHQYLTAAWIDHANRTGESALGPAAKTIPDDLVDDLMDVCMHHAKLPITDCPLTFKFDQTGRKQLVAALLRFSDELDVDGHRVSIETVKNFALDPRNSVYWWLHNRTKVVFGARSVITLTIRLHSDDVAQHGPFVHAAFITEFQTKNQPVLTVLGQNGIPIVISSDSKVVEHDRTEMLPPEITQALQTMQARRDPLLTLADEVRTWLQAIRYEVSEPQKHNDRVVDMIATLEQGALKQRVLVRCIDGEILPADVDEMDAALDRKMPQGWLISDKRVSDVARARAAEDEAFQVFNLSDFLRQMVWGPYFNALTALVEKDRIPALYVDLACYRQEMDEKEDEVGRDRHASLDSYIDDWLKERGKQHISLLGEFGTGKTWFCRHYAYRQLERYLQDPANERLPLLITLRAFAKAMTPQQLINDALLEQYKLPFVGSAFEVFQGMNRRGKLLLVLDGFDEMARQVDYQTVVDNFWQLASLVDEGSKVILTSRTEYFRWAKESERILGGEEYGRRTIVLAPPKFEVLHLEPFDDDQIRQVIIGRKGAEQGSVIAERILNTPNLAEMARKPVLVELLLAALDEVSADVLENPAQVYLYATNKLLLRNIDTQRTFTKTADKLYFLCELAWEMIKSGELRIHYAAIPDRIKTYFGDRIKDQHELDTWDFDLRNQTLLHRDAAGYYEFAHKGLAEYFVAFKFAAEIGCLALPFVQTYCEVGGLPCKTPIEQKDVIELAGSFGALALKDERMEAIRGFLVSMISEAAAKQLWQLIGSTKGQSPEQVKYTGGNAVTLLHKSTEVFKGADLTFTVLIGADLHSVDLGEADLQGANLGEANLSNSVLRNTNLRNATLSEADLSQCNMIGADLGGCNLQRANLQDALVHSIDLREANLLGVSLTDPQVESLAWSVGDKAELLAVGTSSGSIELWNVQENRLEDVLQGHAGFVTDISWNSKELGQLASVCSGSGPIIVWNIHRHERVWSSRQEERMINRLYLSASGKYLSTSHGGSGNVRIWDVTNGTELAAVEAQSGWCNAALFLLDDSKILSTGYGGDIRIWDWKDHEMTSIFAIPGAGNAYELQLSRSQDRIGVIASFPEKHQGPGFVREAKAYVWTFPDFRPILEISLGKQSGQMNLSPDGSKIAIALMASSRVILKILDDQSEPVVLMENPLRQIERTSFSSDGRYLAIGCGTTVRIFDVSLGSSTFGQCLKTFDTRMDCHGMQINSARGLEHEVAWRAGGKEHKGTLLEFFADRGAILDEEQQKLLMELRKQRETRQEPPQDRKSADKPRRKHRRK